MADAGPIQKPINILLIAPHGVKTKPKDDIGTAELTRQIQGHLGCDAIINTEYRKPKGKHPKKRNGGKPNVRAKVLDLNIISQAKKHPDWIEQIKQAVDKESLTYVFWIHGIDDGNIESEIDCYVGVGQPNSQGTNEAKVERFTSKRKTILF